MRQIQRPIITRRDIADGAVTMPKRIRYDGRTVGKFAQTLIFIVFPAKTGSYDTLTAVTHRLGKVPQHWKEIDRGIYSTTPGAAPGTIYVDYPKPFTSQVVAFRCTVPQTWAIIALF